MRGLPPILRGLVVLILIGGAEIVAGCSGGAGKGGGAGTTGVAGTGGGAGTTGVAGTGGGAGTTGAAGTGGGAGTTGAAGAGGGAGTTGAAGAGGGAGTTGAAGTGTSSSCTFTQSSSTSSRIPTVGIVTWSTALPGVTSAQIDFGLTTSYGMTAPVDLNEASYRTLLLGMKPSMTYHYRITASAGGSACTSDDYTIATGALQNGLPFVTVNTNNRAAVSPGFIVTGQYANAAAAPAFILDADAQYVWWYNDGSDVGGAHMSYDGKYMWIASVNKPDTTASDHTHRVTMDGLSDTDFTQAFAHHSHQVRPLPDGSVAFFTTGANGCDDIKVFPANGTPTTAAATLVNARTAHGGTGACNVDDIEYSPSDDTLIFSDMENDCLTKISRTTGATVWVLNGNQNGITSTFTGDLWAGGQFGFHVVGVNELLIFNNNSANLGGTAGGSIALELTLDPVAKTSTKKWSYTASPAIQVDILGDVERLPNGNTIIDYAIRGTIQEVDASGNVLMQMKSTFNFGFFDKSPTLYGPPTK
jgi:Arylsulfotransferase (ASST)